MSGNSSSKPETTTVPTGSNANQDMSHEEFLLRDGRSVANYLGPGVSECGYCKNEAAGGRGGNNMIAYKLTAHDYQSLIHRGWRRSGTFCYQPTNTRACCPNYTIICKALEFKFSRSKRKCIDNLNKFLITGLLPGQKETQCKEKEKITFKLNYTNTNNEPLSSLSPSSRFDKKSFDELKASKKARDIRFVKSCERKIKLHNVTLEEAIKRTRERPGRCKCLSSSTNSIKAGYASALEDYLFPHKTFLERKTNINKSATDNVETTTSKATLEQSGDILFKPKHQLEIKMLQVESKKSIALRKDEHEILMNYQDKIHNESMSYWDMAKYCDFLVDTPLFVEPLDQHYDYLDNNQEPIDDTFAKKAYEYESESDYILVKPPNLPTAYGTYHCTYHLDDKLIACGVLDVLPTCITTAYFFYDTNYSKLNLGYYSALVEISMIRRMAQHYRGDAPNKLVDYNIGYYVHECPKMHYKTTFQPSFLLCSETANFEPLKDCLKKLTDVGKYVRFSPPGVPNAHDFDPSMEDILKIPISVSVLGNKSLTLSDYFEWLEKNIGKEYVTAIVYNYFTPYAKSVGRDLLPKIILQIDRAHKGMLARYLITTEERVRRSATTAGRKS